MPEPQSKQRDQTTVYLVHHGDTRIDEAGRVHGWSTNPPLTPGGREDVKKTVDFLASKGIGEVYSSDLQRAVETAELLRSGLKIEKPNTERFGLRPMDVGVYAGMKADDIEGPMDDLRTRLWKSAPGGESVGKFLGRWGKEFDRIIREALGEDYACVYVTHSHNLGSIPYLLSDGRAPIRLKSTVGPGGVTALHIEDGGGKIVIDVQFDPSPTGVFGL